jgi:hypothetical protein
MSEKVLNMKNKQDQPTNGLGLLANGASGRWDVALDESLEGEEWSLEIDGPQVYLVFQLEDLTIPRQALDFLQLEPRGGKGGAELVLGKFGPASVSLLRDNEGPPRYFLVVGPRASSTLRLSLTGEDIQMFGEALRQVVADLPQEAGQ